MTTCSRCAHEIKVEGIGTGYAKRDDAILCYDCDQVYERRMIADAKPGDHIIGYVGENVITTWPGRRLMDITQYGASRGWHRTPQLIVWARDDLGRIWYGRNGGTGMIIRLRLLKNQG